MTREKPKLISLAELVERVKNQDLQLVLVDPDTHYRMIPTFVEDEEDGCIYIYGDYNDEFIIR